jgi:hypothetical protein
MFHKFDTNIITEEAPLDALMAKARCLSVKRKDSFICTPGGLTYLMPILCGWPVVKGRHYSPMSHSLAYIFASVLCWMRRRPPHSARAIHLLQRGAPPDYEIESLSILFASLTCSSRAGGSGGCGRICRDANHFSPHHPIPSHQDPSYYYKNTNVFIFLVVSFPLAFLPIIHLNILQNHITFPAHFNLCELIILNILGEE